MRAGCSIRLSTPPSDSASAEQLRPAGERDRLVLRLDEERDHAAEVAHLPPRDLVAGMARRGRGRARARRRGARRGTRRSPRVLAVLAHAQRERLDPAQDEPGVERAGHGAERLLQEAQPLARAPGRSWRRSRRSRRSGRRGTSSSSGRRGRRRARAAAGGTARRRCCRRRAARRRRARAVGRAADVDDVQERVRRRLDPDDARRRRRGGPARLSSNSSAGT